MVTLLALIGGIYCVSFATTQFLPGWKSMSLAVLAALALIGSVVYALMQPAFTFSDLLQTWLIVFPICLGLLGGSATRAVAIARSPMSAIARLQLGLAGGAIFALVLVAVINSPAPSVVSRFFGH